MRILGSANGDGDEMAATHVEFDIDRDNPEVNIAEVTAELEDAEIEQMPALYERMDHLIENLYSNPPDPEAQIQLEFTYAAYRIVLNQDGHATFMKVDDNE